MSWILIFTFVPYYWNKIKSHLGGNGRRKKLRTEMSKKERTDRKRSEGKSRLWKSGDGCDFQ